MNYFKVPSKHVPNPETMSIAELKKYKGVEHQKLCRIMKNMIKGKYFFLVPFGVYLVATPFIETFSHMHIFGKSGKGGDFLNLKTKLSDEDIRYNRELQKLRFLSEPNYTQLKEDTESLLEIKKMGGDADLHTPKADTVKVVPHLKYI